MVHERLIDRIVAAVAALSWVGAVVVDGRFYQAGVWSRPADLVAAVNEVMVNQARGVVQLVFTDSEAEDVGDRVMMTLSVYADIWVPRQFSDDAEPVTRAALRCVRDVYLLYAEQEKGQWPAAGGADPLAVKTDPDLFFAGVVWVSEVQAYLTSHTFSVMFRVQREDPDVAC